MDELKYPFVRSKLIPLGFLLVTIVFLGIWLWIRGKENANELIIVANLFLPVLIVFGLLGTILQFFVISRLYFVKLTPQSLIVYRVFPKSFNYSDIKAISFSNQWLKGIDTGSYMQWPIAMKIESSESFLADLKSKHKKATGKTLVIKESFS